jgi:hypothetical protein
VSYKHNVLTWLRGWRKFDEIAFLPGWSGGSPLWWLLYALNHGTRTLSGGAVVTWSRWFYLNREKYRAAAFMTRLLNHFDQDHGRESADPLWKTTDTEWAARGAVAFWCVATPLVAWLLGWLAGVMYRAVLSWTN